MTKRAFEWMIFLSLSPVLLALLGLVALAVGMAIGRPLLFRQLRPGLRGALFPMYKFRTMTDARDATGELLPDGARLNRFGRLLRSTSLDELPSLINFVRGEMALVGPRPLLPDYLALYSAEQARRHDVRPGLTGWAQVNGRNSLSWDDRLGLDVWYVDNRSLWLDIRILFLTVIRVARREGISEAGGVTMSPFTGPGS